MLSTGLPRSRIQPLCDQILAALASRLHGLCNTK
jgi:hypothetical protein